MLLALAWWGWSGAGIGVAIAATFLAIGLRSRQRWRQALVDHLRRTAPRHRDRGLIKTCDSFDAARLLLVPGYLEAGETLVALIPDRDTLVLTTPPADDDWAGLRTLAGTADGDPLYTEPLVVTSAGIATAA